MLDLKPPDYRYCPFCGRKLETKVEEGKERKYCGDWTYYPHVAMAVVAVIIRKGKVLLVKRAKEPHIGTWMFPAGFIEFGELPPEALAREVKEETGSEITNASFLDIFQSTDDYRSPGHLAIFYLVEIKERSGMITDREENSDIGWFDIDSPPEIGWQSHQEVMKRLQVEIKGEKDAGR